MDIKFFDQKGQDISKGTERKIENLFFREDFRRVYLDDIGQIEYAESVIPRYTSAFLRNLDLDLMRKRHFRIVVDYGHGASVNPMSAIFNEIGADVIALNATRDPLRYSRTNEEFDRDTEVLASITGSLKTDLGVRIDTAGERIYVVDDRGRLLDGGRLLAAMAELMLRGREGGTVAVPVTAPSVVETVILILDEATSSVDTETELRVRDALNRMVEGRTSLIIAHRLSTVQNADAILVFHKGRLREMGSHQNLLAQRGIYWKLYQLQYKDQEVPVSAASTSPIALASADD